MSFPDSPRAIVHCIEGHKCGADCLSRFNGLRPELQTRRKAPWAL